MWRTFGFYIPDMEYCKDPEGLVKYLVGKKPRSSGGPCNVGTGSMAGGEVDRARFHKGSELGSSTFLIPVYGVAKILVQYLRI